MYQHPFVSLSDQCTAIILGSLLGDGSLKIHQGYQNARFSFRHSIRQKEYFKWKVKQLSEISGSKCVFLQPADGFGNNIKLRYQSLALPALTDLYRLTHPHAKFCIRRTWLNQLTPLSLAIWWFDDGSLIANSRKGVFCTDGFDEDAQHRLAQYFKVVWGIQVHVGIIRRRRNGQIKEYYRLWIRSTEELKKFLRIVLPFTKTEVMLPKVLLMYKDSKLQQRWISEVVDATEFSLQTVEKALATKQLKWKAFRE
jgi:hypothetical protein